MGQVVFNEAMIEKYAFDVKQSLKLSEETEEMSTATHPLAVGPLMLVMPRLNARAARSFTLQNPCRILSLATSSTSLTALCWS